MMRHSSNSERQSLIVWMSRSVFAVTLALTLCGCAKSSEELLIGRWYSGEMTIRFRPDRSVAWNSSAGMAIGRYQFLGENRQAQNSAGSPNLVLDVIRKGESGRYQFQATLLGKNRLQLKTVDRNSDSLNGISRTAMVLRRASDDKLGGGVANVSR
ncbi:hypothetical protein KOR42_34690 [Thalassoglobus neptunius]|uniref:Lipocalin-like domain-containing protein n=1 Tax=Thalassoglobus neptunius TaxID=1938619 RepID=A0A5C5WN98_9PLAN|nr:hypothetical protein [Thalassoglobus neptunius]TWT51581.1 hypothetical protein KOR42_34690 [Thalassoglobus neptunius]